MHFFLLFVQFLTGSSTLEKLELWWAMNLLMPLTIQVKCVCLQKFSTGISTHNCFDLQLVFSGMQSIETYLQDRIVHYLLPPEKFCCDEIML